MSERGQDSNSTYVTNGVLHSPSLTAGRRASESAITVNNKDTNKDTQSESQDGTFSGSASPSSSSPAHSSSKSRRTGAKIIASALAMARSRPRPDTPSDGSTCTPSPSHGRKTPRVPSPTPSHAKNVPKISLTEHSEDDYDCSSPEHHHKTKKSSDSGLRAVREKMRRGFSHPLRRFRSEANVCDSAPSLTSALRVQDATDTHIGLALSVGAGMRLGVGGGEGDASELLDPPLSHAKSQPNLLLLPTDTARSASSTKVTGTSTHMQRSDVFINVRGVAGRVQGLHIPRSGLQLFLRVRLSEDKSSSSSSSSSRNTKTIGRSRLVPASPSPVFECEWAVEGEVGRRSCLVLEVRTGSRELLNSANIAFGDLFTEPGSEGSVETWVNLQGGASLHLRANHGGEAPPPNRRRSLFRSWSLHRLGRI